MFYFAWLNLKERSTFEHSKIADLLLKSVSMRTENDILKIEEYNKSSQQLEDAMLRLDNLIFLFRDV